MTANRPSILRLRWAHFLFPFALASFMAGAILSFAATVTGPIQDPSDVPYSGQFRQFQFTPISTPQVINGTTIWTRSVTAVVSNGNFRTNLEGGFYWVGYVGEGMNGMTPRTAKALVPPFDTNTYTIGQCLNFATNGLTFYWTNRPSLIAGTNIVFTTNGAYLVINSTASGSGGTTYTFYNTNLTVGVLVTNGARVAVGTNTIGLVATNDTRALNLTNSENNLVGNFTVANAPTIKVTGNAFPVATNGLWYYNYSRPNESGAGTAFIYTNSVDPNFIIRDTTTINGGWYYSTTANSSGGQCNSGTGTDWLEWNGGHEINFQAKLNGVSIIGANPVPSIPKITLPASSGGIVDNSADGYVGKQVRVNSDVGTGIYGNSSADDGVVGSSTAYFGVSGYSTASYGVYGNSSADAGVYGYSTADVGVFGNSSASYGVQGYSTAYVGVLGDSSVDVGVYGYSDASDKYGVYGTSSGGHGVYSDGDLKVTTSASFANGAATISSIGTITGNGSGLTNLNASKLTSGSIPAGVLNNGTTNTLGWLETTNGGFHQRSYNAGNLTNLNASQLTGLVPESALPNPLFTNTTTTRYIWTNSVTGGYQAHVPGLGTVWGNVQSNSTVMVSGGNGVHIGATNSVGASNLVVEGTSILKGLVTGNLGGSTNLPLSGISTNGGAVGMIPTVTSTGLVYTVHNDQPASSVLTNLANNNGGGLTNLTATNLVGTVPIGNLPALNYVASTNGTAQELSIKGTNQFYSTPSNSVIATVINGQTNQLMLGTNRLRILFNGVTALTISNDNTIVSPTIANPTFTGTPTNLNFVVSTNGFSEGQTNDNAILTGTVIASTIKSLDSTLKLGEGNTLRWQFYSAGFLPISDNVGTIGAALNRPKSIWTGTGTNQFDGLISANVGFASFASNTLAPSSITFPASNANWTNTFGKNIFVFIDNAGVTGTVIKINGTQIASTLMTTGVATIPLQPNEFFSETYTIGTPTATWKPQ